MTKREGLNAMDVDPSDNGSSFDSDDVDEESFSDDDSSLDSSNHDSGEDQSKNSSNDMKEICDIAQEDSRILRTWRYTILFVLIISFVGTITAIILFLRNEAKKDEEVVVRTS
jgi:hypothetical protein